MISFQDQKDKYLILVLRSLICFIPVFVLYILFKNQDVVLFGTLIFLWSIHILVSDVHLRQKPLRKMSEAFLCVTLFQILAIPFQYHVIGILFYLALFAYMSHVFLYLNRDYLYNFVLYFMVQNVALHGQTKLDILKNIGLNFVSCLFVTLVFFIFVKKRVSDDYDYKIKATLKTLKIYLVSLNHFVNSDTSNREKKFVLARNQANRHLVAVRTALYDISANQNASHEELFQTHTTYMRFILVERFIEMTFAFGVKVRTIQAQHEYSQLNLSFSFLYQVVQRFLELLYSKEKDELLLQDLIKMIENALLQQQIVFPKEADSHLILKKIAQAYEQVRYNMQLMVEELKSLQNLEKKIEK